MDKSGRLLINTRQPLSRRGSGGGPAAQPHHAAPTFERRRRFPLSTPPPRACLRFSPPAWARAPLPPSGLGRFPAAAARSPGGTTFWGILRTAAPATLVDLPLFFELCFAGGAAAAGPAAGRAAFLSCVRAARAASGLVCTCASHRWQPRVLAVTSTRLQLSQQTPHHTPARHVQPAHRIARS